MTSTMVATPQHIDAVSPALAAVCRYEPRPGKRKSLDPSTNISHTISANHPPATDIIEFHTSPIAEKGNSHRLERLPRAEAVDCRRLRISFGMLFSEA